MEICVKVRSEEALEFNTYDIEKKKKKKNRKALRTSLKK